MLDLNKGKSPYFKRHGKEYDGPKYPFGCAVRYLAQGPMAERNHTFSSKTRVALYLGPELNSYNEFKGICMVIDAEALAESFAANDAHIIRVKSKENFPAKWPDPFFPTDPVTARIIPKDDFYFPCSLGILGQPLDDDYSGK